MLEVCIFGSDELLFDCKLDSNKEYVLFLGFYVSISIPKTH